MRIDGFSSGVNVKLIRKMKNIEKEFSCPSGKEKKAEKQNYLESVGTSNMEI
jgi:hypothetical protein